jgi:streptogramin lyase
VSALAGLCVLISILILSSCGGGLRKPGFNITLAGRVHGGQQAVSSSTIQLYAAGATGYGSTATPLLTKTVTSNGAGDFTITGDYSCPTPSTQVYIVATGGNPGLAPGTNNTALAMMAALGPCVNLTSSTFIFIDEVTTVASVYALAPFMSTGGGTKLGATGTNAQGLANAFATVNNLANTAQGTAPGPNLPTGATAPTAELNTLADLLSLCVNTSGPAGECTTLFNDATPNGMSAPTNTIDALLDIALNPGHNVSTLFNLVTGIVPFEPTLAAAPNDWTVAINYTGGGLNAPKSIAVDSSGDVWVANGGNNSISKFSSSAGAISGAAGYTGGGLNRPWGIAIDTGGNVWIADPINIGSGAVSKFSSSGSALSGSSGYTGNGLSDPFGLAINGTGVVWVANQNTTSAFLGTGAGQSGSPYVPGGGHDYYNIAIDSGGNVWMTDKVQPTGDVEKFTSAGVVVASYTAGGQNLSWGVAIDSAAHVWISNNGNKSVTELNSTGTAVANYTGGGLSGPQGLAVDGQGNVWVANNAGNSVTELNNSGAAFSPATTGFVGGGMSSPFSLAIDGSGNVWVSNNASGSNSVTEIVGAAAPVVTPLALAVKTNTLGKRP